MVISLQNIYSQYYQGAIINTPFLWNQPKHTCIFLLPAIPHQVQHPISSFFLFNSHPFVASDIFLSPKNVHSFPIIIGPCHLPLCQISSFSELFWLGQKCVKFELIQTWIIFLPLKKLPKHFILISQKPRIRGMFLYTPYHSP